MEALIADGSPLNVPFAIDFCSILIGVITGAIFACDRKLDIVGTVVVALVTAYGGGIIRDLLLQDKGVFFMQYPVVIVIFAFLALFVFCFRGWFKNHYIGQILFFADALSVGVFALAGANKAFDCGEGFIIVVILGAITSVGGGALRDIIVGETPQIFFRANFYAISGFVGALVFATLAFLGVNLVIAALACVLSALLLRYLSVYFDWKTSDDIDLSKKVNKGARTVKNFFQELFSRATFHK